MQNLQYQKNCNRQSSWRPLFLTGLSLAAAMKHLTENVHPSICTTLLKNISTPEVPIHL